MTIETDKTEIFTVISRLKGEDIRVDERVEMVNVQDEMSSRIIKLMMDSKPRDRKLESSQG